MFKSITLHQKEWNLLHITSKVTKIIKITSTYLKARLEMFESVTRGSGLSEDSRKRWKEPEASRPKADCISLPAKKYPKQELRRRKTISWGCCEDLGKIMYLKVTQHTGLKTFFVFAQHSFWQPQYYLYEIFKIIYLASRIKKQSQQWIMGDI